jgi:hypothetical protein
LNVLDDLCKKERIAASAPKEVSYGKQVQGLYRQDARYRSDENGVPTAKTLKKLGLDFVRI